MTITQCDLCKRIDETEWDPKEGDLCGYCRQWIKDKPHRDYEEKFAHEIEDQRAWEAERRRPDELRAQILDSYLD